MAKSDPDHAKLFGALALGLEVVFLILFYAAFDYEDADDAQSEQNTAREMAVTRVYPMFQDVHVMIFIGFGFLMTFLKKYSFSSVSYNMLVAALVIQWSILVQAFFHSVWEDHWDTVYLDADNLVKGDFAAGAILISFGAVLGRISPTQLLIMAVIEVVFYAVNEEIGANTMEAVDMGGSIFVHTFGAYFGLAVSWVIGPPTEKQGELNGSSYQSDMFAMIGTIFLWMFWPSFNGALCPTENFQRERVVLNTVFALTASCVSAFAASRMLTHEMKFDMVHIQNATLAGGVAVGSSSDLVIKPGGAILVGLVAGIVSVAGYVYVSAWIEKKFGVADTCGVHNLHGMPGIIGGVGGAVSAAITPTKDYGTHPENIFAARAHRSAMEQGGYQLAALFTAIGMAIVGGFAAGKVLTLLEKEENPFHDMTNWELPGKEASEEERVPLKAPAKDVADEAPAAQVKEEEVEIELAE